MAPRSNCDGDTPQPAQQQQQQQQTSQSSHQPRFPEHESNPFIAFRRFVDQQFDSMFNAMIPASRYEDSPFWEQKEPGPSQDQMPQRSSRRTVDNEIEKFRRQRQEMENEMEREIARARKEAFRQLPWLWDTATSKEQDPATAEQRKTRSEQQDVNTLAKATPPPVTVTAPEPNQTKQDQGPDTEEQAYLFLNFPHARDQLQSLERKLGSVEREQEEGRPSPTFGPLMREFSTLHNEHHAREQAETDNLLHTLREALRGVEPWERARVTEQLPDSPRAQEDVREQRCPWGHGHGYAGRRWEGEHPGAWGGQGTSIADRKRKLREEAEKKYAARQQQQKQQQQQEQQRETPERTVKAPWWWMGAIWDPTFPREADGYGMRRCQTTSSTAARSSGSAGDEENKPAPSPRRANRWEARPRGPVSWRGGVNNEGDVFTSSLTTTTSSTTQPDGSVLTRVVMEKRHPDGRDERNETVFTQQPGEARMRMQQGAAEPWEALGLGLGTPSKRLEQGTRKNEVRGKQDLGKEQPEQKTRRGWFWAS